MKRYKVIWRSFFARHELGYYYTKTKQEAKEKAYQKNKGAFPEKGLYEVVEIKERGEV